MPGNKSLDEEAWHHGNVAAPIKASSLSSLTAPTTSTGGTDSASLQDTWSTTEGAVKSNGAPTTLQMNDESADLTMSRSFTLNSSITSGTRQSSFLLSKSSFSSPQAHTPSHRKVNKLDDSFTVNQLQFAKASHHLVGREKEIEILQRTLAHVQEHQSKHLVLLNGYAGSGKSALAKTLRRRLVDQKMGNGWYAQGKFDLQQRNNQPYAALSEAVGSLCARLLTLQEEDPEAFASIRSQLLQTLGADLPILSRVFTTLHEVLDEDTENAAAAVSTSQNPLEVKHRLVYAFCRFMRVMSVAFAPLVLVLDDLQWSDGPSLDLIEAVLLDRLETGKKPPLRAPKVAPKRTSGGLLLVGIYRSNEVDKAHLLSSRLREWRQRAVSSIESPLQGSCAFCIQEVEVTDLPFSAVHDYVSSVLATKDTHTLELAELCQRRTHGNIFFLIHFLRLLQRDELLRYSFATMQWTWDIAEIELKTVASDNVVDLLLQKMNDLSREESDLLRLASCLGASFDKRTLELLWKSRGEKTKQNKESSLQSNNLDSRDSTTLLAAIDKLIDEGYLQLNERNSYQFAHDKVEEAASRLTDTLDNTSLFHEWVGESLLNGLDSTELEAVIFVVVNLLNDSGTPVSLEQKLSLARLNRRAGAKAMSLSAYQAASVYVSRGISLLGERPFVRDYELALDLFSTGAEAEASLGNAVKLEEYCQAVMNEDEHPIEDKLRVYTTWLASLANRGQIKEAADQSLMLLRKFGVRFPRSRLMQTIRILMNISKVKRGLKQGLLEKIVSLPVEKDATRIQLLHLLDRLSVYLYYMHDDLMPLVMFRNFQWTLDFGINDVTPAALTTLGIIFVGVLGDLQAGSNFAQAALKLVPRVSPLVESRTLFTAHGFGTVWTQPMRSQLKPLLRSYELGLCSGDTESACWAIHLFYHQRYLTSFPLDLCIADVEMYMPQMKDLNQVVAYRSTLVNYQMFMNLAGRTETDPLSLSGDFCTAENHADWYSQDPFYHHHCRLWECYVRTLYGAHEECADLVIKYGHNSAAKSNPGTFSMSMFEVISKGVSCAVAARKTGKKSHRKNAVAVHRRVKSWIQQGNPNVAHVEAFLDGQLSAIAGKQHAAIKSLQVSIVIAARGGLLLDAALFSECFGEYLTEFDCDEAVFRLQEAIKYYREFGAHRKVQMLERKYGNLWPKPAYVVATQEMDPLSEHN